MRYLTAISSSLLLFTLLACHDSKNLDRDRVKEILINNNHQYDTIMANVLIDNPFAAQDLKKYALDKKGYCLLNSDPKVHENTIVFTDKAKPFLMGQPKLVSSSSFRVFDREQTRVQKVATFIFKVDQVTGIRFNTGKDKAVADITYTVDATTPFLPLDSVLYEKYKQNGLSLSVPFSLYDDGWRLDNKPLTNF